MRKSSFNLFASKRDTIFLSYRRDDVPGYVRQLQLDLQGHFGRDSVFRDVEDIAGGQQWKDVLANNLEKSAALVVVIGPRWEQIWNERVDKRGDYIVYELCKANELGVPIFPVTINGTVFSRQLNLGPVSWLLDKQQYDISDRQGRWPADVQGLVSIIESESGLARKKQKAEKRLSRLVLIPVVLVVLAFVGYLSEAELEPDELVGVQTIQVSNALPAAGLNSAENSEPVHAEESDSYLAYPDIAGVWQDESGYLYELGEAIDGNFMIRQDATVGVGQFMPDLPRKFASQVDGVGYGEYSVTTDNLRIVGWFYDSTTGQTEYGTFWRVD